MGNVTSPKRNFLNFLKQTLNRFCPAHLGQDRIFFLEPFPFSGGKILKELYSLKNHAAQIEEKQAQKYERNAGRYDTNVAGIN